jgi:hypothetical protein
MLIFGGFCSDDKKYASHSSVTQTCGFVVGFVVAVVFLVLADIIPIDIIPLPIIKKQPY